MMDTTAIRFAIEVNEVDIAILVGAVRVLMAEPSGDEQVDEAVECLLGRLTEVENSIKQYYA